MNIGLVGHVDHGKTTLVQALSGEWTDQHSEEMKRGISIRLGYADATFRQCPDVDAPECYTVDETCADGSESEPIRTVSFVDAPGHETLMATMLSGASLMDGAVLVVSATENVPQAQTEEHLMALDIIGIENIVIAQNKIDLVSPDRARRNYEQIQEFVEGTVAEDAPVVPISAQQEVNVDLLIQAIEEEIPTPDRDPRRRPADVRRPQFRHQPSRHDVGRPHRRRPRRQSRAGKAHRRATNSNFAPDVRSKRAARREWESIQTDVRSLQAGGEMVDEVTPGGLLGVGTGLDPSLTKGDALAGQVAGTPGSLPPTWEQFTMKIDLLDRLVGMDEQNVDEISTGEPLMLTVGTATTVGAVTSARDDECEVSLKRPVCAPEGAKIAINRRIGARWRLIGIGTLTTEN